MPYRDETKTLQRDVLLKLGYPLPRFGADGVFGNETHAATELYLLNRGEPLVSPPNPVDPTDPDGDWFDVPNLSALAATKMKRITLHWSAGGYRIRKGDDVDDSYHYAFDQTGKVFVCEHSPEDNIFIGDNNYAAHTRAANTNNVGLSCAAMFDFDVDWNTGRVRDRGKYPLRSAQVEAMCIFAARISDVCNIPVTRETILGHAEWPVTLGIAQRGKWDFQWLPGWSNIRSPVETGDILRQMIASYKRR